MLSVSSEHLSLEGQRNIFINIYKYVSTKPDKGENPPKVGFETIRGHLLLSNIYSLYLTPAAVPNL